MSDTRNKSSPEFRDRAVRMVKEHRGHCPSEWVALTSIAGKAGCTWRRVATRYGRRAHTFMSAISNTATCRY